MLGSPTSGVVTLESLAASIDSLAQSVKKGFDGVDERFEQMNQRFNTLERKVDRNHVELSEKLELCASKSKFSWHEQRISAIEKKLDMPVVMPGETSPL